MKETYLDDAVVLSEHVHGKPGFEVFLSVDDDLVHLCHQDSCKPLFRLLNDGMRVGDLRQAVCANGHPRSRHASSAQKRLAHLCGQLLEDIDNYGRHAFDGGVASAVACLNNRLPESWSVERFCRPDCRIAA